jgi:serine protease Do
MRRFIVLIVLLISFQGNSQVLKDTICNFQFFVENQKIIVSYDLNSKNATDSFFVDLKIHTEKYLLLAKSITGDIKVTAGNGKKIIWNAEEDGFILDENVSIEITAHRKIQINKYNHILKSFLVPGLGDYKIRNGKLHFLTSILAYGSIGSSVYFSSESLSNYQAYKQEYELEKSKMLFEKATLNRNLSIASAGIAATVWVVDYALLNLRIRKVNKEIEKSKYYYGLQNQTINYKTDKKYINTKSDFLLAIEKGDNYSKDNNFKKALESYQLGKSLAKKNTEILLSNDKIISTQLMIDKEEKLNADFAEHIKLASDFFNEKQLEQSKAEYKKALDLKPTDSYVKQQLNQIELLITEANIQMQYNVLIEEGNKSLKGNDLELAISKYEQAAILKPNENYPQNQISICRKQLEIIEKQKVQNEFNKALNEANQFIEIRKYEQALEKLNLCQNLIPYVEEVQSKIDFCNQELDKIEIQKNNEAYKEAILNADKAWDNKLYDDALVYYREALTYKPNENYPKDRIKKIEEKINAELEINSGSGMSNVYEKSKNAVFFIETPDGTGTGFFISSSGIAVSCYHVFEYNNIADCDIVLLNKEEYKIEKVLEQNFDKDYIIFKVAKQDNKLFDFLPICFTEPKLLEDVISIGYPDGFFMSFPENGKVNNVSDDFIFHNANITYGNSGGPLINSRGEVVGINAGGFVKTEKEYKYSTRIILLNLKRFL